MATQFTVWPLRRALSRALRDVILTVGVPSINAYLKANLLSGNSATVVQFGNASIVLGTLQNIAEATLEIDQPQQTISRLVNTDFEAMLLSTITLNITQAGDNDPEDIKFCGDVVCDALSDIFNQQAQARLTPKHADGTPYLPGGAVFQDCCLHTILHPKTRTKQASNITEAATWTLQHVAFITFSNLRPDALGLP